MTATPDLGAILAPILARVAPERVPLLLAVAERMAAERYRRWAEAATDEAVRAALAACAAREETIAARVEALHPGAAAIQDAIRAENPDLVELNRSLFAGRPLREQLTLQAAGERLGAATWRAFAQKDPAAREALLACAILEEESAGVLEALLGADAWPFAD